MFVYICRMPSAPLPLAPVDVDAVACCGPSAVGVISSEQAETAAALLKAVADPTRLRLLSLIRNSPGCEACVCDLAEAVGLSQPTVSHHLRRLVAAGVLDREARGTWAWYRILPDRLREIAAILQ